MGGCDWFYLFTYTNYLFTFLKVSLLRRDTALFRFGLDYGWL